MAQLRHAFPRRHVLGMLRWPLPLRNPCLVILFTNCIRVVSEVDVMGWCANT